MKSLSNTNKPTKRSSTTKHQLPTITIGSNFCRIRSIAIIYCPANTIRVTRAKISKRREEQYTVDAIQRLEYRASALVAEIDAVHAAVVWRRGTRRVFSTRLCGGVLGDGQAVDGLDKVVSGACGVKGC